MQFHEEDDNRIKRFLLGDVTAEEEAQIEGRLFADSAFVQQLGVVEQELMDDYLCDRLTADERTRFENHFLATRRLPEQTELVDTRREQLLLIKALKRYAANLDKSSEASASAPVTKPLAWGRAIFAIFDGWWRAPVFAALLLGVGAGVWLIFFSESSTEKGLAVLEQAYHDRRPFEARITGFSYAPFSIVRGDEAPPVNYRDLEEAELLLRKAVREKPDATSLYALGKLYFAKKEFAKAIDQFEQALKTAPNNARLRSDLGAALLEESKKGRRTGEQQKSALALGRSLDELNRAAELDNALLEAYFNRALCRQLMGLDAQAEQGWKEYLEKDGTSQWAEEARQNLKRLEEKRKRAENFHNALFEDFLAACATQDQARAWAAFKSARSRTGNTITNELIERRFELLAHGQSAEAKLRLQQLAWAGELEARQVGDHFTADLASYYQQQNAGQMAATRQARQLLKQAAASYDRQNLTGAAELFTQARDQFLLAGDLCEADFAESWIGYCQTRLTNPASLVLFERLTKVYREKGYKSLLAYALHSMADAHTASDEWSAAIDKARRALALAQEMDDALCQFRARSVIVWVLTALGRSEEALAAGLQNMALLQQVVVEPKQIWGAYRTLAETLLGLDYRVAALDVQQEVRHLAVKVGWPEYLSLSFVWLGMINSSLGRHAEALKYADLALAESQRQQDKKSAGELIAAALFYRGHLSRQARDYRKALDDYGQAVDYYAKGAFQLLAYQAHEGSFLASLSLQDDTRCAQELNMAGRLLEEFRGQILEENTKNSFFDTRQEFYDAAIDFEFSRRNDPLKALQLSEDSHARSLLASHRNSARVVRRDGEVELELPAPSKPLDQQQIRQQMPAATQILQYAVLPDKVVIWVITRDNIISASEPIALATLELKVKGFVQLISSFSASTEDANAAAKELYDILIKPVAQYLDPHNSLCIVPDKSLHLLPFAALLSPTTHRYFIADYTFTIAPSATAFIFCTETARLKASAAEEKLLCVGNPRFDYLQHPTLADLPAAAEEAQQIAAFYRHPKLLTNAAAREPDVRAAMPSADVIHLAGHAVADERAPLLSKLLLAPAISTAGLTEANDGILHSYELYQLGPLRAKLVILSACRTGIGRAWRGEGVSSLARPFFSTGVPATVVSLWSVEATATAKLMISFHQQRRSNQLTAVQALRAAQLELLNGSPPSPIANFTWAAFVVVGSAAHV